MCYDDGERDHKNWGMVCRTLDRISQIVVVACGEVIWLSTWLWRVHTIDIQLSAQYDLSVCSPRKQCWRMPEARTYGADKEEQR